MARYIDADKFKSHLEKAMEKMHIIAGVKAVDVGAVIKALDMQPTADVVPKSEVASEIFAEVNMQIIPYSTDIYIKGEELIIIPKSDYNAILTELEKKYTEGEDKPASEEKYFSPEDVRKMTNQEVREKYTAIRKSMERW